MITTADLVNNVQYFGAKIGEDFKLIGYVDVLHGQTLVFHANLTQRDMSEVEGLTSEEIQTMAQNEAYSILGLPETGKIVNDYITLVNLGLYGQ